MHCIFRELLNADKDAEPGRVVEQLCEVVEALYARVKVLEADVAVVNTKCVELTAALAAASATDADAIDALNTRVTALEAEE